MHVFASNRTHYFFLSYSEMACHIDGCVASQLETVFVTGNLFTDSVVGRAADVIFAVQKAAEILSDVVVPGMKVSLYKI